MRNVDTYGVFDDILGRSSVQAQAVAHRLRALIAEVYPEVVEVPWPSQRVAGYGVGPKKMTQHFCYLAAYKDHINLGFNHGAALSDPECLLEGPGEVLRHVRVATVNEAEAPGLRHLLEAALAERRAALTAG